MRDIIPQTNKYFPQDTRQTYLSEKISFPDLNFFYLFNLPNVIENSQKLPDKIRINEKIQQFRWDSKLINSIGLRLKGNIESLKDSGVQICGFQATCQWRLVIGLGASHPQETSMTLHHTYGIPYIPGSAIKGITRHWAVLKFADSYSKDNNINFEEAIKTIAKNIENGKSMSIQIQINNTEIKFDKIIEIFGTQKNQGKIIFMDAYPVENVNLKIDIMNPHYSEYYSGDKPPADWQKPNPIKFLAVKNTKFQFYLLSRENNLLDITEKLLKDALKEHGIGAKTSLGYGIFEEV